MGYLRLVSRPQRILFMLGLVVAGEAVFILPFHLARFFRSTLLDITGFTNTELGAAQAAYGVIAMIAYFPGGPIADRFSARKLLAVSLVATGLGGFYMATFPAHTGTTVLFGFWGVSTILLFWAALIRATRDWGGADEQGRAYGILDGGRGLVAALLVSAAVVLFQLFFPDDPSTATLDDKRAALRSVVYAYSLTTIAAAVLVWFVVPERGATAAAPRELRPVLANVGQVLRVPSVWLLSLIVVCAYVGYKGFDNYSLFAVQAWGMDEVEAAKLTALGSWVRPIAALAAGFLGDRLRSSRVIIVAFALLLLSHVYFAFTLPAPSMVWVLVTNILIACAAIYGLRGIYFALFEEAQVPRAVTGTAVGLVSVIGYTPDVFVSLVNGIILDQVPGAPGHQLFYGFLAVFAALGLITAVVFERVNRRTVSAPPGR